VEGAEFASRSSSTSLGEGVLRGTGLAGSAASAAE
jgi:hypothetical protein